MLLIRKLLELVDTAQPSNVPEIKPRMKRSADVTAVAEKEVVEEA